MDIAGYLAIAILSAGLQMVEPLGVRYILDSILLDHDLDLPAKHARLGIAGVIFVAVIASSALASSFRDYRQQILNTRVILGLKRAVFEKLLHLPLDKLYSIKGGGALSRLNGDVDCAFGLLQTVFVAPCISGAKVIFVLAVLTQVNWRLAISAVAFLPVALFVSFLFVNRVRPIYRSVRDDMERTDGRVGELLAGIRVVRGFRRELFEALEYARGRHAIARKELFAQRRELAMWTAWNLLLGLVGLTVVWYGAYLYLHNEASIGDIAAFQWYAILLLTPVWNLVNAFSNVQRSFAAMERVFDVLKLESDKPDIPLAGSAPNLLADIQFDNVTFAYIDGRPVLENVAFTALRSSVVALVGRSGAGKSTLTDLIARFQDPSDGRILLNGVDIRDFGLSSYRELIAIVQQSVFLFDGSVRDNIAYGRRGATDVEVEIAARKANAHEFIMNLPRGYETQIGPCGVTLSGGQQQRLAIARAIAAQSQIIILDEATSSLDSESEVMIQTALTELREGRIVFVIAHRLPTITHADMILVLERGHIVERGTHADLMRLGGTYWQMVNRQRTCHGTEDVQAAAR
jgi:ATP-binding cassette subfamily B protein